MPAFTSEPYAVERLVLDPDNPRLPESISRDDPAELLRFFIKNYDLDEIGWSMAEHGYFAEEPLLTVTHPKDESLRIVVEGNRRLATLKLLTDQNLRSELGAPPLWSELAEFAAEHELATVPTHHYSQKADLLDYLGFRHVSGLMPWTAEAKARYIYRLVTEYGYSFQRAARAIGSRQDAIRRNFVAWATLEQARKNKVDVTQPVRRFGVYYRSLQSPSIRRFLTLAADSDPWLDATEQLTEPLDLAKGTDRLQEFIDWVWGSKRVLRESRDLDNLARVLDDPGALAVLREERRLDVALDEIPSDRSAVYAAIRLAYRNARKAYGESHNFKGDEELVDESIRLSEMATRVLQSLEAQSGGDQN